jgi:hypothetical protein
MANLDSDNNGIADILDIRRTDIDEEYKDAQTRLGEEKLAEQIRSNKAKEEIMKQKPKTTK